MRIAQNSWLKVSNYLNQSPYRDMAVIAIGSIESHGRHMPLGTDMLIPDKILELMEQKVDILIAPTLPYGATDQLMGFPGTISLGLDGLTLVLTRITHALYRYGIREFIILNGHGGNIKTIESVGLESPQKRRPLSSHQLVARSPAKSTRPGRAATAVPKKPPPSWP